MAREAEESAREQAEAAEVRAAETRVLQEQLLQAQAEMAAKQEEIHELVNRPPPAPVVEYQTVEVQQSAYSAPPRLSNGSAPHHAAEDDDERDDAELVGDPNASRHEEDRQTARDRNAAMQAQLAALSRELEEQKRSGQTTRNDELHAQNQKEGRDKYKTLKQIRSGNTKRRVDLFEGL